ncbi:hypothetical protein MRB53_022588 [Persea americana]|uniref:Uncharacterized protein n=1 Tax=Persea americana TaxID=3435 RepID=A0ACC2L758_PERAE|nr:hypothetical protein MRB53_022588 [Persea americana]
MNTPNLEIGGEEEYNKERINTQGAFVLGRKALDQIVVAKEMIHVMSRQKGCCATVAVKLDVEKAYDTFHWDFLQACLTQLGFDRSFTTKIMLFVSSVKFTIRVNGRHTEKLRPEHGFRQGDPLPPYIYILCAETLSKQVDKMAASKRMLFPKIAPNGGRVGLLQFTDDLLLFLCLNAHTILGLHRLLTKFEEEAGQASIEPRANSCSQKMHPQGQFA